jgi:hypothetical protein
MYVIKMQLRFVIHAEIQDQVVGGTLTLLSPSSCGRETDTAESFCQLRYISLSEDKQVSKKTLPLCIKHHDAGKLENQDF